MKTAIAGKGFVGLASAVLLVQRNKVVALDIVASRVHMPKRKHSPFYNAEIANYQHNKPFNFRATNGKVEASSGATGFILVIPTAYDPVVNNLDTLAIRDGGRRLAISPLAAMCIKGVVPMGNIADVAMANSVRRQIAN